jgi:cystathionine gamma-lyase
MTYSDGTRCVHAGAPEPLPGNTFLPSPVFASAYHLGAEDIYGGMSNPSWRALETAIGELDGGECVSFASGMAATTTLLRTVLGAGDLVVVPTDGYYLVRAYALEELARFGIRVRQVPTDAPWDAATVEGARLVLLETPANPGMAVCDVAEISALAHAAGALVAVDNTTATPLGQRPLELGADICIASDTKALAGHSDVVLGHVSLKDDSLAEQLRRARRFAGATPGPFEAWMVHRGLSTLDLRLARQGENARALTTALAESGVRGLRWPGDDALARKQMLRFGGVFCFDLGSVATVERFVARADLVGDATSFGGVHSTVDRRARWGDPVGEGFVRFSCGIEDTADLVADVLGALGSTD